MRPATSNARPLEARIVKLLLINYEFPPVGGGAANATSFLSRALVGLGHEVTVLTTAFGPLRGTATEAGVDVVRVRTLRRSADRSNPVEMLSFLLAALIPGIRLARRRRFDATIAFFTIPSGPIACLLRLVFGIPYLVSLRGGDVPGFVPEIDGIHRLISPLRRAVLARACAIVANSPSLARLSASADPFPVEIIPNGVDPLIFAPAQTTSASEDEFRILFVGRLHAQKNVGMLLESAAALAALPGPRVVLEIVGDGPERTALEKRSEQTGAAAVLRWHGWLDKPAVLACYRRAHVFVNPSLYEGMPNTVLEAMACGVPVVASRIGGNEDLVVDGETGLLFELAAPQLLTAALQRLRSSPQLGLALGTRGRRRVTDEFSWPGVASQYLRIAALAARAR
jgi:glycosyltransferase involved in cell wall biosynthesis